MATARLCYRMAMPRAASSYGLDVAQKTARMGGFEVPFTGCSIT